MDMRAILALLIVLCGSLCGKALAGGARRRAALLEQLAKGVKLLRIHMTGMGEPVRSALERSGSGLLALVGRAMEDGVSASEAWESVKRREHRRGGHIDALDGEDIQLLDELFSRLGESGREEQELRLGEMSRALETRHGEAQAKLAQANRLYCTLGTLIGLMLGLIVI